MKNVICIYAQRTIDGEWEEANALASHYNGNTIAVIDGADGLEYDFTGCAVLPTASLDAFFSKIGVEMGQGEHQCPGIFSPMQGNPSLN